MEEKVIYTDGRDVTVTDTTLKVKKTAYKISGITRLRLWTIRPDRWPGILLLLLGIAAIVCGYLRIIPASADVNVNNDSIDPNTLALWIGTGLALIGIILLAIAREKYSVRISTAEGDKDALVSEKREYVAQIVDALNRAFSFNGPGASTATNQTYTTGTGSDYITIREK